jgi:hypothetical protein
VAKTIREIVLLAATYPTILYIRPTIVRYVLSVIAAADAPVGPQLAREGRWRRNPSEIVPMSPRQPPAKPIRIVVAKPSRKHPRKPVAASVPTVRCDAASLVRLVGLTSQAEPVTSVRIVHAPRQKQRDAWARFLQLTGKG